MFRDQEFWNLVDENMELGYIHCQKHPDYPLWIYNYSNECMFDAAWNEATVQCRGLIVDEDKNIVALPFKKFHSDSQLEGWGIKLPNEPFEVYDKLDGSLCVGYFLSNGEFQIATRGSFTSEQAIEANKIWKEKYSQVILNPAWTWLFEIIIPENRIVVDYGKTRDLFLLAIIDKTTGKDIEIRDTYYPFPVVKRYDGLNDFDKILERFKDTTGTQFEGVVVKFKSGFRVKLKTENYKLLHKLFTGLSERRIWENISQGIGLGDILKVAPDEFFEYIKKVELDLRISYSIVEVRSKYIHDAALQHAELEILKSATPKEDMKRKFKKDFAEYVLKCEDETMRKVAFQMYSGGSYEEIIWKSLKPKGNQTFRNAGEIEE